MNAPSPEILKPRALTYRGSVEAAALFFDPSIIGAEATRRRILDLWHPGTQVHAVAGGYLLRWPEVRRVRCDHAPGLPLVAAGSLLLAAPLSDDEHQALQAPDGSLILVRGGALKVFSMAGLPSVDLASWLDVAHYETLELRSLGEVPPPPALMVKDVPFNVRESLAIEAAPDLAAFLAALRGQKAPGKTNSLLARLLALQERCKVLLKAFLERRPAHETASPHSSPQTRPAGTARPKRWQQAWRIFPVVAAAALFLAFINLSSGEFSWELVVLIVVLLLVLGVLVLSEYSSRRQSGKIPPTTGSVSPVPISMATWRAIAIGALVIALVAMVLSGRLLVALQTFFFVLLLLIVAALVIYSIFLVVRKLLPQRWRNNTNNTIPISLGQPGNDLAPEWVLFWVALGFTIPGLLNGWLMITAIAGLTTLAAVAYGVAHWGEYQARRKKNPVPAKPPAPSPPPEPPEKVDGPFSAWRNRLARLAWEAGLWRIYGPAQARYIIRMMQMFERGELDAALSHAIPIDALPGTGPSAPAFGVPRPRSLLEIFTGRQSGSSIEIGLPGEFMDELRRHYRRAHEKLDAQGRHQEAAFVLAELLQASEEAVAYLERYGRLQLAAELAEGRKLPPDLIVRQWLVAGNRERAVRMARRHGAFLAAITRLERGSEADKENARGLRLLWANELARSGNFVAAVETAWQLDEARPLVQEWIMRGLAQGGLAGARMLARQVHCASELDVVLRERVLVLLNDSSADTAPLRLEFANRLSEGPATPVIKTLTRAAARALARDAASDTFNDTRRTVTTKLINLSDDGALRADLPASLFVTTDKPLNQRDEVLDLNFEAADTGPAPLLDAAFLPDGRCVVALGEAGARLISRDGRTTAHFDQPCHSLVVSDQGDRALALAPRGDATKLARIDFVERRAVSWCETRLGSYANSYDGSVWFAAANDPSQILAIDATAPRFGALWHTPDTGVITCIERSTVSCSFLSGFMIFNTPKKNDIREKWERWQLEVPSLTLRQRNVVEEWSGPLDETRNALQLPVMARVTADGQRAIVTPDTYGTMIVLKIGSDSSVVLAHATPDKPELNEEPAGLVAGSHWWAAFTRNYTGVYCYLIDRKASQVRARLYLQGTLIATARFTENHFTLCDDRGRLLVFDLERGALVRDLRVS